MVKSRVDFSSWLRANDLASLAHNISSRRLGSFESLLYVEHDEGALAGVHVFSLNVRAELRAIEAQLGLQLHDRELRDHTPKNVETPAAMAADRGQAP